MFLRLFTVIVCLMVFSACNPNRQPPVDPAAYQTPAAEAVFRYTIEHCRKRKEARVAVLCIGDSPPAPPMPEFVDRFKDVEGLKFVDFNEVVAGMVNGKARRYIERTNEPVLEVQISKITDAKDGKQEAVAAWAFKDDAERKRLEVKEKPGGGFEIRELENIPVPHRNDDRSSAAGK